MKCIAVDDEPAALGLLSAYMEKTNLLEPCGTFLNALEAVDALNHRRIDLIFLDIQMPDLNGFELLCSLKQRPLVVFTTAYREYALDGFQVDAVDYLLKPILFPNFLKAVHKARDLMSARRPETPATPEPAFLFLKVDQKRVRLDLDEIELIEGNRDYITIHTRDGRRQLTLLTLNQMLEKLPATRFARVHRSFIVNLSRCDALDKFSIQLGKRQIPIGKSYRESVFALLQDYM